MMATVTLESLLAKARMAIEAHNAGLQNSEASPIDIDNVFAGLRKIGGTTVEALREVSWEDLERVGLPMLLAKCVAQIFRTTRQEVEAPRPKVITAQRAPSATAMELLGAYDPKSPSGPVADELRKRSNGRLFIVFNADGSVNLTESAAELAALMDGEPEREHRTIDEMPVKLYRVGDRPPRLIDEHPLFPGVALRRDGTCERGWNWLLISFEVRVLLRLAVQTTGELVVNSRDNQWLYTVYEQAMQSEALKRLRLRFPKASMKYTELQALGRLPQMKVLAGADRHAPGVAHPFFQGGRA